MLQQNKLATVIALALTAPLGLGHAAEGEIHNPDLGGGKVLIYSTDGTFLDAAHVGNLPDMVTFADATTLVVANEGEPADDYVSDPQGSVSIITLNAAKKVQDVTTLGFEGVPLEGPVRIKPGSTAAADLEPEYVAVSPDGSQAWVSLQENNAVAFVDVTNKAITKVKGLGQVAWRQVAVDIVDDGKAQPVSQSPKNIFALRQPDTLIAYSVNGNTYFVSANEGDDREYGDYADLAKAAELTDNKGNSLLSAQLQTDLLGTDSKKLRVLKDMGQDANGVYRQLYMSGTRSFSIFDASGELVYDSGAEFEQVLADLKPAYFNTRVDDTDDADDIAELAPGSYEMVGDTAFFWEGVDARSLKKGVEPEALAVHAIGDKVFAYIGLEKQGGFFVYDITNPAQAQRVDYVNDIDFNALPSKAGDLAPEGMVAFTQGGEHYLAVANELSSNVTLYQLGQDGKAELLNRITTGSFGAGAAEIVDYSLEDKALFVTNAESRRVDIIDVSNPAKAALVGHIDFSVHGEQVQSVSVRDGLLAIAVVTESIE